MSDEMTSEMISAMVGYIYLIQEREFILQKVPVVKLGRTENVFKRFMQYPKGSVLLFTVFTNNYKEVEKELIKRFCIAYKARPDIGREYFEGDYTDMAKKITEIARNIADEMIVEPVKLTKSVDPTICIMDFINENRDLFSNKTIQSKEVYNQLIEWVAKRDFTVYITHTFMTHVLIRSFGVGHKVCRFADGVNQGIVFPDLKGLEVNEEAGEVTPCEIIRPVTKKTKQNTGKYKDPYECPRCGYTTVQKGHMRGHFYDTKKPCPTTKSSIELTDEIKKHIVDFRVYNP
jgi:hypothetical protein